MDRNPERLYKSPFVLSPPVIARKVCLFCGGAILEFMTVRRLAGEIRSPQGTLVKMDVLIHADCQEGLEEKIARLGGRVWWKTSLPVLAKAAWGSVGGASRIRGARG